MIPFLMEWLVKHGTSKVKGNEINMIVDDATWFKAQRLDLIATDDGIYLLTQKGVTYLKEKR